MNKQNSFYKWLVLSVLFLNVMFGFGGMNVIAPLSSEINGDMGLSLAQVGATIAFFTLASPVFSPFGGVLTDKFGARWVLTIAGIVIALSGAARYFVTSAEQMIALMFIAGLGFACVGPVIPKALSAVFSEKEFGKANGIAFSAFWVGSTLAFSMSVNVLSPFFGGWRNMMLAIGALSAISAILWLIIFRDAQMPTEESVDESNAAQESGFAVFKRTLFTGDVLRLSFFYACCIAALFSILGLLPRVLEDRGLADSGMLASVLTGTMVAFNVLGGMLSDKFGRKAVLSASCILFGLMIPALIVTTGPLLYLCLFLAGAAAGPIIPVTASIPVSMKEIGPKLAGTALGALFMIGNLGGFFGPIISGWLMDSSGSAWNSFLFLSALMFVALFLMRKVKA